MHASVLFIICVTSWVSLIGCRLISKQTCTYRGDHDERCLSDGTGYERYTCNPMRKVIKDRETKCTKPLSGCRCYDSDDYYYYVECECYNPRRAPQFPPIGVLKWNGTWTYDDFWWAGHENERTAILPGEIHKNGNGNYLMKETKILKWPSKKGPAELKVEFEIIVPYGDGEWFIKYTGNDRSKICRKEKVSDEKTLYSLWKTPRTRQGREFTLLSESERRGNITTQEWEVIENGDDWDKRWRWTVEYDYWRQYAIPTHYWHEVLDGFVGENDQQKLKYVYLPLNKDDESFEVEDYCSNV